MNTPTKNLTPTAQLKNTLSDVQSDYSYFVSILKLQVKCKEDLMDLRNQHYKKIAKKVISEICKSNPKKDYKLATRQEASVIRKTFSESRKIEKINSQIREIRNEIKRIESALKTQKSLASNISRALAKAESTKI